MSGAVSGISGNQYARRAVSRAISLAEIREIDQNSVTVRYWIDAARHSDGNAVVVMDPSDKRVVV